MNRTGRTLALGCLLLVYPLLTQAAGGNSLLIPAMGRCTLNTLPENLPDALSACLQAAQSGDAQAQYELGEFYYEGKQTERDLSQALNYFEKASLQGHAQAQYRLGSMFAAGEGVPVNNIQAYVVLKWLRSTARKMPWTPPTKCRRRCSATSWKSPPRCWGRFSANTCLSCRRLKGVRPSRHCPEGP